MIDLTLTDQEQAFRQKVRAFLRLELTEEIRQATAQSPSVFVEKDIALAWQKKLYERGWLAPRWPVEYGGAGWGAMQRYIYDLEAALAGAPGMIPMGLGMVAPVIMKFGTPEQKAYYLPRILTGEHYWCQGYSEPQSGSDLASLQCKAVRDGDHYVVNGTKIWTTHAHYATHIFVLARTNADVKPQQGISFLLIPMTTLGITVTPIKSFAGDHDVNQVFFDDVRVPVANLVGVEGQGWTCAKYLLEHERGGTFGTPLLLRDLENLQRLMQEFGGDDESAGTATTLRRRLAELEMDTYCLQQYEIQAAASSAKTDPVAPSIIKTLFSETQQKITELAMDVAGPFATILDTARPLYAHATVHELPRVATVAPSYLNFRAASIYAGTNEVQRTVIAKSVLSASPGTPIVFNEDQQILLGNAEHFAAKFYSPGMRAATEQTAAGFTQACWDKFIELGWQYVGIPARFDGLGGSFSDWTVLAYGLGSGLLIEPLFSALALPAALFAHARDEAIAVAAFERIAAGEHRYAIAQMEYPSHGNTHAQEAIVRHTGRTLLLTGKKTLVRHAAAATRLLVAARMVTAAGEKGRVVILEVPANSPGLAVNSYHLMDGSSVSDVSFDQVTLDEQALIIAEPDAEAALAEMLTLATAITCADSLKQIEVMLALTVDYLNSRSQFGTRLAGFQVLQHRVADMHMHREIAASALQRLLQQIDTQGAGRDIAVSLAKAQIDGAARFVGQQAIQLHGGIGVTQELSVGAHFKRTTTNEHWYGDRSSHLDRFSELASTTAMEKSRTLSPVNRACSSRSGA